MSKGDKIKLIIHLYRADIETDFEVKLTFSKTLEINDLWNIQDILHFVPGGERVDRFCISDGQSTQLGKGGVTKICSSIEDAEATAPIGLLGITDGSCIDYYMREQDV